MKRIDHLLFQADPDFIGYHDARSRSFDPTVGLGPDVCDEFGCFVAGQVKTKRDVRHAIEAVEAIMQGGGWNAEQIRRSFFPTLDRELKEEAVRLSLEAILGPLSRAEWTRLRTADQSTVI